MPWKTVSGQDGKVYYYHTETLQSTWDKPEELFTDLDRAILSINWKQYTAEGGNAYWYNALTGNSVWETPPEVQELIDRYTSSTNSSLEVFKSMSQILPGDEHVYIDRSEENQSFKQLLRDSEIDSSMSWSQAMKKLVQNPQYWSVREPSRRKQYFEEYLEELKNEKLEQELQEREAGKEIFLQKLKNHFPGIKYYSRWTTWKALICDNPDLSVDDEESQKSIFEDYVQELRNEHDQKEEETRQELMDKIKTQFAVQYKVDLDTKWADIFKRVKQQQQQDDTSLLHDLDVLEAFEDYIKDLEKKFNQQRQDIKQQRYRQERKCREEFVELLQELGMINSDTTWSDVYPLIESDERYINLCGQPGSTPLELFWDMVEEENRKVKNDKELILDAMAEDRFKIDENTTFEQFHNFITAKGSFNSPLEQIFKLLKSSVIKQKEGDRHAEERRTKRAQESLRSVIKRLDPPISLEDPWEAVKARLDTTDEFHALPDDDTRREAFEKQLRRIKERRQEDRDRERDRERRMRDEERRLRNEQRRNLRRQRSLDEGPNLEY